MSTFKRTIITMLICICIVLVGFFGFVWYYFTYEFFNMSKESKQCEGYYFKELAIQTDKQITKVPIDIGAPMSGGCLAFQSFGPTKTPWLVEVKLESLFSVSRDASRELLLLKYSVGSNGNWDGISSQVFIGLFEKQTDKPMNHLSSVDISTPIEEDSFTFDNPDELIFPTPITRSGEQYLLHFTDSVEGATIIPLQINNNEVTRGGVVREIRE